MATRVTKSIGATGRDYSTITSWEAATDNDLVTADEIQEGQLYDDAQFTEGALTITGATTDSTRYRELTVPATERFDPKDGTGVDWVASYAGSLLTINEAYFRIVGGMKINNTYTGATNAACVQQPYAVLGVEIFKLYLLATGGTPTYFFGIYVDAGGAGTGDTKVCNCIAVGSGGAAAGMNRGFRIEHPGTCFNCVAYEVDRSGTAGRGFAFSGAPTVRNCIATDSGETDGDFKGGTTTNVDYCTSSDTSAPGANSNTSEAATDIWLDPANGDFYLKTGSVCRDDGETRSSDDTTDFNHNSHGSAGSWEMGAYDFQVQTITPDPANLTLNMPAMEVSLGNLNVTPDPANLALTMPAMEVSPGNLNVTPDPANLFLQVPWMEVALGNLNVTPDPANLALTMAAMEVALGNLNVTPDPANLSLQMPAMEVGLALTVSPDALSLALQMPAMEVDAGQTITPDPANLFLQVPFMEVALGNLTVTPDPANLALQMAAMEVALTLTVTPDPANLFLQMPFMEVALGTLTVTPDAANLTLMMPDMGVTVASTTIDVGALDMSLGIGDMMIRFPTATRLELRTSGYKHEYYRQFCVTCRKWILRDGWEGNRNTPLFCSPDCQRRFQQNQHPRNARKLPGKQTLTSGRGVVFGKGS